MREGGREGRQELWGFCSGLLLLLLFGGAGCCVGVALFLAFLCRFPTVLLFFAITRYCVQC